MTDAGGCCGGRPPTSASAAASAATWRWLAAERGQLVRRLRRAVAVVGRRPRRLLAVGLGPLRPRVPHAASTAALADADDAGRPLVPRRRAQLRRPTPCGRDAATARPWSGCRRPASRVELTVAELRDQVAPVPGRAGRASASAGATGWRPTCPNIPETVVAFLATASLGAIWSSCAPEFGTRSVVDRLAPDRARGAAGGRRLPLRRQGDRPHGRGGRDPRPRCRRCGRR